MVMPWWHCERGIKIDAPGKMVLPSVHTTRTMGKELEDSSLEATICGSEQKGSLLVTDLADKNGLHVSRHEPNQ